MTPNLDLWLQRATHDLSELSAAQVRAEIQEHYEAARDSAIADNYSPDEANRMALSALGDAKVANRRYRRVLLTVSEARLLKQSNAGAWMSGPVSWHQLLLWSISIISLLAAGSLFWIDWTSTGRVTLAFGLGIAFTTLAHRLPVYTVARARVFRCVEWIAEIGLWLLAFGPGALGMPWLLSVVVFQLFRTEWKRASIRRKLPVTDWPRQLFL